MVASPSSTTAISVSEPIVMQRARDVYNSPTEFARLFLKYEPTVQQKELFAAIAEPGAHVGVKAGHGTGKSTGLATTDLWFLFTRKNALVPCTAPTGHQLEDILWREMRRLIARMDKDLQKYFLINNDRVFVPANNSLSVARTARPENPDALQGFHSEEILFLIDEAAGVAEPIFEVAQGALSTKSARVLMTANPTQLTGYFFNAFNMFRDSWTRLTFSCLDSPLVDPAYPQRMAREYGEDSDIYRIRVLGEFPCAGLKSIIPADLVDAAIERVLPMGSVDYAPAILGVDPAWEGSDRSVVVVRKGIWGKILFVGRGLNGERLANVVIRYQDEYEAAATAIDKTGVGASVCDFLSSMGRPFNGISFGGSPVDERFMNRRAEIWWLMREWFEKDVAIDNHPDLKADLIAPEYGVNDRGKLYLESKEAMRKRGVPSPDLGDGLALTFAVEPAARTRVTKNTFTEDFDYFEGM